MMEGWEQYSYSNMQAKTFNIQKEWNDQLHVERPNKKQV